MRALWNALGGPREAVLGYPVLGTDEDLTQLREKYEFALVTVGQIKSATPRKRLYAQLIALGLINDARNSCLLGRTSLLMQNLDPEPL